MTEIHTDAATPAPTEAPEATLEAPTDVALEGQRQSNEVTTEQIARAGSIDSSVDSRVGDDAAETQLQLLPDTDKFSRRWDEIQATFVDEPRASVERADALVAEVIQELARTFADERKRLEQDWSGGRDVSTESLRVALQRYRDFFHVLLRS